MLPKIQKASQNGEAFCTRSGNRTRTRFLSQDFKSCVSTYSTIPASLRISPSYLVFVVNNKALFQGLLERKTRFELATPTLARSCSTS